MNLELAPEFSYWVAMKPPVDFGPGPFGSRSHFPVIEGAATGARFNATSIAGGGDWLLVGPDGWGRIDVRVHFETDDGARVFVQYFGLLDLNEAVTQALANNAGTDYEDQYFRTTPRFETGDPRYAWMNQSVFVSRGRVREGFRIEYEVFRVL